MPSTDRGQSNHRDRDNRPNNQRNEPVDNALNVSVHPPDADSKKKTQPPYSTSWTRDHVKDVVDVSDWYNAARWFAARTPDPVQIQQSGKKIAYKLQIERANPLENQPKATTQEFYDINAGKEIGEKRFRSTSLYRGWAFGTMSVSNAVTLATAIAQVVVVAQAGAVQPTSFLITAGVSVINAVVNWAAQSRLQSEFKNAIGQPFDWAISAKGPCDKLAWAANLYHNIRELNPIPRIWGTAWLFRPDWTTFNWFNSEDSASVPWNLDRIRDAAVDAYVKCLTPTKDPMDQFAGDKFFDDKLKLAEQGIGDMRARWLRLPTMMAWASVGFAGAATVGGLNLLFLFAR